MTRSTKKISKRVEAAFAGRWRIVEMELWDEDAIDLDGEGSFSFTGNRQGRVSFICVVGFLDCRYSACSDGARVDFSWEGHDEDMAVSGRGWAVVLGEHIEGRIYFHNGDDSSFRARRRQT